MTRGFRCPWKFSLVKVLTVQGLLFSPIVQDKDAVIPYLEGPKTEAKPYKCGVSSFMG